MSINEVLTRVGDKWSLQVISRLGQGTLRFTELRRSIDGISQRMLTLTLRQLERDGLVERTVYPTVPPKVEYALSDFGRTILIPVTALANWALTYRLDIQAAREAFDSRQHEVSGARESDGKVTTSGGQAVSRRRLVRATASDTRSRSTSHNDSA